MKRIGLAGFVAVAMLGGCAGNNGEALKGDKPVPENFVLGGQTEPVLMVRLKATREGYQVIETKKTTGAPTMAVFKNRDVRLSAMDQEGKEIHALSIDNPLVVHTAGTDKPAKAMRKEAEVTVFLPHPDKVRKLAVQVIEDAKEGRRQVLDLYPR